MKPRMTYRLQWGDPPGRVQKSYESLAKAVPVIVNQKPDRAIVETRNGALSEETTVGMKSGSRALVEEQLGYLRNRLAQRAAERWGNG